MRSKLVFPSGGMETKYVWNKSTINDKGVFVWDKNDVITIDTHYWNKYEIDYNTDVKVYNWDKFKLVRDKYVWYQNEYYTNYTWDKYEAIIDAEDTYTATYLSDNAYGGQYSNMVYLLSNIELNKQANAVSNNEYTIYPLGADKNRVFTFYYALPISQYEIAPIKKVSYTAQELYNLINAADDNGNLYLGRTTICGFADNGLENGYADKVIIPSVAAGWTGSQFETSENTENPLLSYIKIQYQGQTDISRVNWINKAAFDNGYYTHIDTVANDYTYKLNFAGLRLPYLNNSGEIQQTLKAGYSVVINYLSLGEAFSVYVGTGSSQVFFYYDLEHIPAVAQKGDFIEQITSDNEYAYPQNGIQDGYWYEFNNSKNILSTYLGDVNADTADAYPQDGAQDGYYYRFKEYVAVEPTYKWNKYNKSDFKSCC